MLFWRIWAILLGSSLMIGETIRSWGQGRHPLFVLDDFVIGIPLVVTGILMAAPTVPRRCAFAASFAAAAGMLYGSFFGKVVELSSGGAGSFSSNLDGEFLTILIGMAFVSSLAGLIAAVRVQGG